MESGEAYILQQPEPVKAAQASKLFEVKQNNPKKVEPEGLTKGAGQEEFFLKYCSSLEAKERGGELPDKYSSLTLEDIREVKENIDFGDSQRVEKYIEDINNEISFLQKIIDETIPSHEPIETIRNKQAKLLEKRQLAEAVRIVASRRNQAALVDSKTNNLNPLQEEMAKNGNFDVWLKADTHLAPSDVLKGIRVEAFQTPLVYRLQRRFQTLVDRVQQFRRFRNIQDNNVKLRYVIHEDVRNLYYQWMTDMISTLSDEPFKQGSLDAVVLGDLGDKVQDGAYFLDQLFAQTREYGMIDEISNRVKDKFNSKGIKTCLLEIFGNHDQDARIPESVSMLGEVFGQRIYAQEIGGVLVAAVDTNIENPEWVAQFEQKAGDAGKEILKMRKQFQEDVLTKIQTYGGPVVLLGHNPARIVEAFAQKRKIIQESNIVKIIAGHTHKEDHVILPYLNKNKKQITMDVIESFIRVNSGSPDAPKLYRIKVRNGQVISDMETYQEPKERFSRRYNELVAQT